MQALTAFALFFIIGGAVIGVLWIMKDAADTVDKESNEQD